MMSVAHSNAWSASSAKLLHDRFDINDEVRLWHPALLRKRTCPLCLPTPPWWLLICWGGSCPAGEDTDLGKARIISRMSRRVLDAVVLDEMEYVDDFKVAERFNPIQELSSHTSPSLISEMTSPVIILNRLSFVMDHSDRLYRIHG